MALAGAGSAHRGEHLLLQRSRQLVGAFAGRFGAGAGCGAPVGQLFVALAPDTLGTADFSAGLEEMLVAMTDEPGVRIPGMRRQRRSIALTQLQIGDGRH